MSLLLMPAIAHAADKAMEAYASGDFKRAYKLWRPLADKRNRDAQFNIGSLYEHGQGVAADLTKATDSYRKAASQGHEVAQFNLGNMYDDGRGVSRDLTLAMQWLLNAANQGFAPAQFNLAMKYHHAAEVRDYEQAAAWYQKAADKNHLSAMVNLGTLYMSGLGVTKDDARAAQHYVRAATQGHALAQSYMGDMYRWGRGVERDHDKAVYWYRESAEQGDFEGLLKLAMAYRDGVGVFKDLVLAYVFAIHDPKIRKIDLAERIKLAEELRPRLTDEQRAEVDELSNAWRLSKAAPVRSRTGRE